jgi:O-antigen/teichoic acid export membrane protein
VVSGFFIMMGTIVFTFFMTAGRWLIKWLMDDVSFAIYSLAASLLGFVLIFVNAVNKVFYPYLCRQKENKTKNNLLIDTLLVIATLSLPFFFLMKVAIYSFLPKYIDAVDIVKYLLLTLPAVVIIQSYYVNLYKVKKLERQYLKDGVLYAAIALVLNIMALYIFRSLTSIAIATVISSYIWFLFPNKQIHIVCRRFYIFFYFISVFGVFLSIEAFVGDAMMAFLASLFVITLINAIFYQSELKSIFSR